jgi:hypothetical protein
MNYLHGWPGTAILPISASQVARIGGMSHQCLAQTTFLSVQGSLKVYCTSGVGYLTGL